MLLCLSCTPETLYHKMQLWLRRGLKETNLSHTCGGCHPGVGVGGLWPMKGRQLIYHKLWPRRDLKGNHHIYLWWE